MTYQHLEIERRGQIGLIWLNRPEKYNALSADMWADLPKATNELTEDSTVRVMVVAGRGPAFTVGIDLDLLASLGATGDSEAAQRASLYRRIKKLQASFSGLADSPKPVIAAVHGYCLGAGIDLVAAADIRLASIDAVFGVRETAMGLVADVGTLQRLPRIIGPGHVAEMVFTGRDIDAARAQQIGLVNQVYPDVATLMEAALELGDAIASNSPLVVQGVKQVLRAGEGKSISEGLDYVALWNAAFLLSDDLNEAMSAFVDKRPPNFKGI
ncbi:MAG: crotonase/enoyl-CoA hydratase family protein [Acidimicrobiia bacterium]